MKDKVLTQIFAFVVVAAIEIAFTWLAYAIFAIIINTIWRIMGKDPELYHFNPWKFGIDNYKFKVYKVERP